VTSEEVLAEAGAVAVLDEEPAAGQDVVDEEADREEA
jgi:hypothetical protein